MINTCLMKKKIFDLSGPTVQSFDEIFDIILNCKKRKNEKTIFIVEKKSEMPTTTMMASSSGSKSFNVQEQVNKEKILMNLQYYLNHLGKIQRQQY